MYCKYCGNLVESGDVFCSACGAPLNRVQQPNYSAPAQNAPATKAKTSILALIFAIASYVVAFVLTGNGNIHSDMGTRFVFAFGFGVTAIVLGAIGNSKGYKYGLLSLLLGIFAVVLICFTGLVGC